ncbi:MAG: type II toxin-antitoxin system RelB/DinJ family antitoxin [Clostridia bacterium]
MAQTNVNIRMDEELKKQFDMFCSDIGMSMTTAFCVFAKTAVRERRIPFEISASTPISNLETLKAIEEMDDMIKNKTGKVFHSVDELFEELNS